MNPALLKLLAQMKSGGRKAMGLGKLGVDAAGSGAGQLAGMAARNPKTAAGIGALGAGGIGAGAGAAMSDDDDIAELLAMLKRG